MNPNALAGAIQVAQKAAPELAKLKKATTNLEAVFAKQLMEQLAKGTKIFGEGPQAEVYGDLFTQAIGESVAKRGALGIGDLMYRQTAPRVLAEAARKLAPENP